MSPSSITLDSVDPENPMAGLLAQAQQMQSQLVAAQEQLAHAEVKGTAGNGLVQITGTGSGDVTGITIDKSVVDPDDVDTLTDLLIGALEDLARNRDALTQEKIGPLAGGLGGFPGLG